MTRTLLIVLAAIAAAISTILLISGLAEVYLARISSMSPANARLISLTLVAVGAGLTSLVGLRVLRHG